MSLNDIGRCENCGCNLPEAKPILNVKEIEDIILANAWDEDASMGEIRSLAKAISAAMRKGSRT